MHGKDKPVYSSTLEREYKLSGTEIREMIGELRDSGEPIASGSKGYFYAKTYDEIIDTSDALKGRATKMFSRAQSVLQKFRNQQENLFNQ